MFTFLRKIRKSLIESSPGKALVKEGGSARKYLLYAFGEIALVVIGILIALQINNWNEEKKEDKVVRQYMINLISDLSKDRSTLINNRLPRKSGDKDRFNKIN